MNHALKSKNVLTPDGLKAAVVIIENGLIREVLDYTADSGIDTEDFGELVIMPALTDTHVHINEPGRTEWEGFETATKSAAAGGITMLTDMPLNSTPVTTNVNALKKKTEAAINKLYVDCGFYAGVIPGNSNELEGLIQNGVLGFKAFMIHSGIDDFPDVSEYDLRKALDVLKSMTDLPLLVHAELEDVPDSENGMKRAQYDECSFKSFVDTRPKEWENKAIELLIKLCREYDYHIHIVHLSSSDAIEMIRSAKQEGLKLTVETCPHYLYFSSEEIADKDTRFKCTPPIRDTVNREKLWDAVREGVIDFIVSDHSPCDPGLKCFDEGSFEKAWGGLSSLQLGLSIVWTAAKERGFTLENVSKLMSANTAAFIGLENKKGKIEKGFDADLVFFDPVKKFIVDESELFHRHKITPYSGRELCGVVNATYLRGKKIFENGKILSKPEGEIIFNHQDTKSPRNIFEI
ncbi:MAG: allantoinase AllB [Ignavibacteria bacterium]|nr:allantoinase AllB [Ignavibacteria bacterium]